MAAFVHRAARLRGAVGGHDVAVGNVDTDRYLADGVPKQVMLAVRELDEVELPRDDWQNTRLFYTHGFGAVVNQANAVQADGQPQFLLKDVPPVASVPDLELDQPRAYFGETYQPGRPVIVKTGSEPQEIDFPQGDETNFNEYTGEAGVVIDNLFKRIAFAFRYRDLNLLISNQIRPDSRVLVERNVRQIVEELVPFLEPDADPYPVILDGRILWVLDLYTTTSFYPYSQPVTRDGLGRLTRSDGDRRQRRDEDLPAGGEVLDARGDVHGVPDEAVLAAPFRADISGDDVTGV